MPSSESYGGTTGGSANAYTAVLRGVKALYPGLDSADAMDAAKVYLLMYDAAAASAAGAFEIVGAV